MKKTLYRSRNRVLAGICQGLADHFDLSVVWIRLGLVAVSLFSVLIPLFLPIPIFYIIAAFIINKEPEQAQHQGPNEPETFYEEDYFDTDVSARTLSLRRLKNRFDSIESRIRRMESYVTNKSYDWERRFNSGQ